MCSRKQDAWDEYLFYYDDVFEEPLNLGDAWVAFGRGLREAFVPIGELFKAMLGVPKDDSQHKVYTHTFSPLAEAFRGVGLEHMLVFYDEISTGTDNDERPRKKVCPRHNAELKGNGLCPTCQRFGATGRGSSFRRQEAVARTKARRRR